MTMINSFSGEHKFLSNFYMSPLTVEGLPFKSVEHAFQAWKAITLDDAKLVAMQPTPGCAKRAGRSIEIRSDWDNIKQEVMLVCCTAKFQNRYLASLLVSTGEQELIEGNNWGDSYWGVHKGIGKNHLGKILMHIRHTLR